ncbi:MAG: SUMF1/EgtB/PvdO family nonheme iron enzyme [Thermoguttaceae bacterium]|nr:SUMF1/EgtB/PvdO family nonheme iron enzyme [Thermoguttaceae bacterium]
MKRHLTFTLFSILLLLPAALLLGAAPFDGVAFEAASFNNDDPLMPDVQQRVDENVFKNLIAFPRAKMTVNEKVGWDYLLIDGEVGRLGLGGRATMEGKPSRLVYYLGQPQAVKEIRVFSADVDARADQDYEIRFANNAASPGEQPAFPSEPSLTTGGEIVGFDGGPLMTRFYRADGSDLSSEKYDWVEIRFWGTGKKDNPAAKRAGLPAKGQNDADDWSSIIELQVIGDPDANFADEASYKAWRLEQNFRRLNWQLNDTYSYDLIRAVKHPEYLYQAIEDMTERFPDEFDPKDYKERLDRACELVGETASDPSRLPEALENFNNLRYEILLSLPLLKDFDTIIARKTTNPELQNNWMANASRGKVQYDDAIVEFDPKTRDSEFTELTRGPNGSLAADICLHWDADKFLFTGLSDKNTWQIFEYSFADGSVRQVTPGMGSDVDNFEGCYVPDGSTIFISNASMMGIPCIGGSGYVGNIYRLEADGKTVRQLTFEQDNDWCPVILENGRIMYLRWEYIDTPHYFSRILFTMNPDGTNQVEHYGSGSYWPNSLFFARPLPGQSSKFVGIVSGHHGVPRSGEMVIFDPSLGRQEEKGAVHKITHPGEAIEPVIKDQLVDDIYPQMLNPWPLSDDYFLVSSRIHAWNEPWAIYLVDTSGNMTLLRRDQKYSLLEPIPLMEQEEPQTIPDRTVPGAKESTVFITDVYFGQGLPQVPRGTVKKLRLYAISYGYRGIGGHDAFGMESCWDGRRMIGEIPVFEDGSATFKIPANTPVVVQPLDENGSAIQLMRSWFVGMPGETESCIGCHETQNDVSPVKQTEAQRSAPTPIEPFYGPERPFSFDGEIQPILDRYCVGCHDGSKEGRPNFADTTPGPRNFSKAYHALHGYVRRPGPESDIHVLQPMEYHSSTSELIVQLEKGHHNVKLDKESWEKLVCWIDLNVPYFGTWTEIAEARNAKKGSDPLKSIASRYVELKELYADNDLNYETDSYTGDRVERPEFQPPEKAPEPDRSAPRLCAWPFTPPEPQTEKLNVEGIEIELAKIPAGSFVMGDEKGCLDELPRREVKIERPFSMMTTEVSNALYALYDKDHDSRFVDLWNKDHNRPGYPANLPDQPVIRVSWQEAVGFCAWLSEKTGRKFRLPTEAEWEWAARGGSDQPMWFGGLDADFGPYENLADIRTKLFVVEGVDPHVKDAVADWEAFIPRIDSVDDGNFMEADVGSYAPNPFGLRDMLGNVCEWTGSSYRPYPYNASDGRNDGNLSEKKVARGGSWRDRPKWGRAGVRKPYESWQRVFNVGIRPVCDD